MLRISQGGGFHLALSGQILREYLVVATRPVQSNGLGLTVPDALKNAAEFRRLCVFCEEAEDVSKRLESLVRAHGLTGKRIHDANVAATALAHGVSTVVTDNEDDFSGLGGVQVLNVAEAMQAAAAAAGPQP